MKDRPRAGGVSFAGTGLGTITYLSALRQLEIEQRSLKVKRLPPAGCYGAELGEPSSTARLIPAEGIQDGFCLHNCNCSMQRPATVAPLPGPLS